MLHMESPHQAIYAPLNQVITDSEESEEEIHNATKHRQIQRQKQQQQQQLLQQNVRIGKRNPPNSLALYQSHIERLVVDNTNRNGNGRQPSSYTTNMQNTFRTVMMSTDIAANDQASNFSSFNSDYDDDRNHYDAGDNVAILGESNSRKNTASEPMSPLRRCCFIASLLLCAGAIIGFIWLVPCSEGTTCPAPVDQMKTHNWFNNYTKIELKGGVNVVDGLRSWEKNLIFLYRGDTFFPEVARNKRNGIISLMGTSGAVAWYDEMMDEPVAIDCTLIDVDSNGRTDCLVIDEYGELGAINPLSGQWLWHFKERSAHKVDALDFPVILPDLNGDGVLEILLITSAAGLEERSKASVRKGDLNQGAGHRLDRRNLLLILSGRTGSPIGDGFQIRDCDILRKLQLDEQALIVTFNCMRNNTEAQRSKSLAELFALITNKSALGKQHLKPPPTSAKIAQHRHYGQRKDTEAQRNIYSFSSGRELVVENRGKCPDNCNVTFILCERRNNRTTVLRNFTNSGMYGMVPSQWHFRNTKNEMSGFVMKFWKWNTKFQSQHIPNLTNSMHNSFSNAKKLFKPVKEKENLQKSSKQNHLDSNKTKQKNSRRRKRSLAHEFPQHEFNNFDHLIKKRQTYTLASLTSDTGVANNVTKSKLKSLNRGGNGNLLLDHYKMQMITETVILVLFIGADTRIENTSQSNIIQFCRPDERNNDAMLCQPDLNNQENSMLIADLDQDGSQELVSYMSTFVQSNDDDEESHTWKLVTNVRLLRLQSELPAFYDIEKPN